MAVISKAGKGVFGGLLPQMILEPALLGNVFYDDLEAIFFTRGTDFASAEPDLEDGAILLSPINFNGNAAILPGVPQYLFSSVRIGKNASGVICHQEVLPGVVTEHGYQGLVYIQEVSFLATPTHPIG